MRKKKKLFKNPTDKLLSQQRYKFVSNKTNYYERKRKSLRLTTTFNPLARPQKSDQKSD
ncbi:hypothetical protein GCM10007332_23940 [Epilithonimonas arachidiradicis]|uniref:Uncharacterized protein n=1 Tax=Epilithonimonas arachidiradicis TaxID=1617282 RepID=A0ABQ1X5S3_9FLAO|nr:hypothetical protein GCM10007332_23940 [Epilithonimonas arachidiradicis]